MSGIKDVSITKDIYYVPGWEIPLYVKILLKRS